MAIKPIVELITAWADYESKNPAANAAEFCSHFLMDHKGPDIAKKTPVAVQDKDVDQELATLIGQLNAIHVIYAKAVLKEFPGIELEWFYFMKAINSHQEARKSDVIAAVFFEQSTGIDILNRIKKAGFLTERSDPADKRAKLIRLSTKGEKLLQLLQQSLFKADQLLFHDLSAANKKLLINLLSDTQKKHQLLISENKHKQLEELSLPVPEA
ncbi:MarR family winged helix-turn-helix transcriptional regulator [Pedobacter gandavensis]|uniref:Winged helix DNA-binding protein n=1 Tax=Pedobacter gandavensis TaxID=2679963 RepID=A0ABR6EX00_9SPHI|nr:MarR family winged helix-turn-helix transcriptional regulator [Pedobacter gandavensis]MBB2149491.1 winged helix DNA-binding protein [Pedobacter gandavensis]